MVIIGVEVVLHRTPKNSAVEGAAERFSAGLTVNGQKPISQHAGGLRAGGDLVWVTRWQTESGK